MREENLMGTDDCQTDLVNPVNPSDTRGATRQWLLAGGCQGTFCERKAGACAGPHVHTGADLSKRPERLLIISGKARIIYRAKDGQICEEVLAPWTSVTIKPGIRHKLEFLEDTVLMEFRISRFDPNKTDTEPCEL